MAHKVKMHRWSAEPDRLPVVLVAYGTGPMSDTQLHLACRDAADSGSVVRVLHVVERSQHVPLSAPLARAEQVQVDALLERAERIVAQYGVPAQIETHTARSVGAAIVAEALEHHARAIFIGLRDRHRPAAALLISATVRHILRRAPCPVHIGYLPAGLAAPTDNEIDSIHSTSSLDAAPRPSAAQAPAVHGALQAPHGQDPGHAERPPATVTMGSGAATREAETPAARTSRDEPGERHTAGREPASSPLNRLEAVPQESAAVEALAHALQALDEQSYRCVAELLDHGVRQGWSCAALLHLMRRARHRASPTR